MTQLLILNGFAFEKSLLTEFRQALSIETLCYDYPGIGESKTLKPCKNMDNLTDWLNEKISDPCHLLAWSFGGFLAHNFQLKFPHKVKKIIYLNFLPYYKTTSSWTGIDVTHFLNDLMSNPEKTMKKFSWLQLGNHSNKQSLKIIQKNIDHTSSVLTNYLRLFSALDIREKFDELERSVFIYSEQDKLLPKNPWEQLRKILPNSNIEFIESGHCPFVEYNPSFIHKILDIVHE